MKYCLGTVQFGMDYGIQGNTRPDKKMVYRILEHAIDNGIEMFDTASAYGVSEEILGSFIRTYPEKAKKMHFVSKLSPTAFENCAENEWPSKAIKSAKESLNKIGIARFDTYLFHNASNIFNRQAVEALDQVKQNGLTRRIGVSIYTPEEAMKALEYPQINAVQIPYNVFDQRLDHCRFFERAKENKILIFARSSLLQGLVMMDWKNLPRKVSFSQKYLRDYQKICEQFHFRPLDAAVGYVGAREYIDYVVFGVDNLSQLKEYIELRDKQIPRALLSTIEKTFTSVEERLVNPVLWE